MTGRLTYKVKERKLLWDEENRLTAIDDNGFISNYWYDYGGERVIKEAGGNEGVFVNSVFSGGRTDNSTFTLYVNPYMVVNQGGHYTKHIYIGSQRVVSKLGDMDSYGADPRRIEYAGVNVDNVAIDYPSKYKNAQDQVKDNYKYFEVKYLGKDNDDYVNGQGFCCTDNSKAGITTMDANIGGGNDNPEKLQFYYHSDHLGSTSLITNLDGDVVQHVEYIPFGEVFLEERNNKWNTPFLFNGKELDEETGLYYYGARYYNPRESVWLSVDAPLINGTYMSGEHHGGVYNSFNLNGYAYCYQSPVVLLDPDGNQVYFDSKVDDKGKRYFEFKYQGKNTTTTIVNVYDNKNERVKEIVQGVNAVEKVEKAYGEHYRKIQVDLPTLYWDSTCEVAKIGWNSAETRYVMLSPLIAFAPGFFGKQEAKNPFIYRALAKFGIDVFAQKATGQEVNYINAAVGAVSPTVIAPLTTEASDLLQKKIGGKEINMTGSAIKVGFGYFMGLGGSAMNAEPTYYTPVQNFLLSNGIQSFGNNLMGAVVDQGVKDGGIKDIKEE